MSGARRCESRMRAESLPLVDRTKLSIRQPYSEFKGTSSVKFPVQYSIRESAFGTGASLLDP